MLIYVAFYVLTVFAVREFVSTERPCGSQVLEMDEEGKAHVA
jgi:hypothetical protein